MKHIEQNFLAYNLSQKDIDALSYRLDHHIPSNITNAITTEFESFFKVFKEIFATCLRMKLT